jgi:Rha family phage regulatory protein
MTNALASSVSLAVINGRPATTSTQVAQHFGKRHADVIRAIRKLETPVEFTERNFASTFNEVSGPNGSVRKEPAFAITRDGFTLLAMGFTGKEALKFKLAYIEAFNKMEEALRPKSATTLLPAQKRNLQNAVTAVAYKCQDKSAKFAEIYRSLKDHFKVATYSEIEASDFDAALTLVNGFEVKTLPAVTLTRVPAASNDLGYRAARNSLGTLRQWLQQAVAQQDQGVVLHLVDHVDKCLVSGFTEMDEAKSCLFFASANLTRWSRQ